MALYKTLECDVLVIGGGAAGCGAAIKARDFAERVVLVDKGRVGKSGVSPFAAGIWDIKFPEDDTEVWIKEIIEHGEYLSDQEWTKIWVNRIFEASMELDKWGQQYGVQIFEKDDKGNIIRRKARSHINTTCSFINALPMMDAMRKKARERGVNFVERTVVTALATNDGKVVGAIGFNYRTGDVYLFKAKAVVAAGGNHSFSRHFTGTKAMSGGVIAACYEAGAVMYRFEGITSNTMARDFTIHGLNLIVASGGRFINAKGEEFMWDYTPELGNRAGLATLALSFCTEVKEGRGPIYLDMSLATPEAQQLMRKLLPESFTTWDRSGIDFFKDMISWMPSLRGNGGVSINTCCETSMPGLYGAGDSAARPPQGTCTIGGQCIGYAFLAGVIAGENAAPYASAIKDPGWEKANLDEQVARATAEFIAPMDRAEGIDPEDVIYKIQEIMVPYPVSFIRNEERLLKAIAKIEEIRHELIPAMKVSDIHYLAKVQQAKGLGLVSELTLRSALFRKESRGFHHREDYPYTDNRNWLKWVMLKKENGQPKIWAEDVPTPYFRPGEAMTIPPGLKKR
ncbi:FAD-dependent oxidoreductase [Chloroflexota bacterium]